jgi:hypothetical protein
MCCNHTRSYASTLKAPCRIWLIDSASSALSGFLGRVSKVFTLTEELTFTARLRLRLMIGRTPVSLGSKRTKEKPSFLSLRFKSPLLSYERFVNIALVKNEFLTEIFSKLSERNLSINGWHRIFQSSCRKNNVWFLKAADSVQ